MNSKNFDLLTYNQLLEMAKNEEHNDGATFRKNIYTKKIMQERIRKMRFKLF